LIDLLGVLADLGINPFLDPEIARIEDGDNGGPHKPDKEGHELGRLPALDPEIDHDQPGDEKDRDRQPKYDLCFHGDYSMSSAKRITAPITTVRITVVQSTELTR